MRPTPRRFLTLLLAAAAASPAGARDVTLFVGPAPGPGSVLVHPEDGLGAPSSPAELQGIVLLPLDFTGRTRLEELLPDRPRRVTDVPGASRLVLPQGQGSLYRYARPEPAGGLRYGFFAVDGQGVARSLLERPATGPLGIDDPFLGRVAVPPSGDAVLVGTTAAAGGDLLEVVLATGEVIDRTPQLAPLDLLPSGLGLRDSWGAAVGAAGVLRFDRSPGAVAQALPLPGAPAWHGGELAFSAGGGTAATISGAGPTQASVFAFGSAGPARRVSAAPAHLSRAGYLPDDPDGPYLALSPDGSLCTWRTEGMTRESWLARTQAPPGEAPVHLTADGVFADTLDETGLAGPQLMAGPGGPGAIVLAVGERNDEPQGGIENLDFYRVELPDGSGVPVLTNLTLSSGAAQPPFGGDSSIDPQDGVYRTPAGDRLLYHDSAQGSGSLHVLDLATGVDATVLTNVKSLDAVEAVGADLALSLRREVTEKKRELARFPAEGPPAVQVLASLPDDVVLDRLCGGPDGRLGLVLALGLQEFLIQLHLPTGSGGALLYVPAQYGPTLGYSPAGKLLASGSVGGGAPLFAGWNLAGPPALYAAPPAPGLVLPGL